MKNKEQMQKERELLTKNLAFTLMGRRTDRSEQKHDPLNTIDGLNDMSTQLEYHGGYFQQNRMIKDKQKSLKKALWYSYQGAFVKKLYPKGMGDSFRVLINPNRVKQDYDEKILSAEFEHEIKPGDILEWVGTDSYWLVYLQQTTELAYFRGNIKKCGYQIFWKDGDETKSTYATILGPNEKSIESSTKHGLAMDLPNYTLMIQMPKNEDTIKYFKRYSKFYLSNLDENLDPVCWRVEAVNAISLTGVIEIRASEYYINEQTDDVDNGIVNGLVKPVEDPNEQPEMEDAKLILGETFIKPKIPYIYTFDGSLWGEWNIKNNKLPLQLKTFVDDQNKVEITWLASFSGQFDLYYGDTIYKTIVVESLF